MPILIFLLTLFSVETRNPPVKRAFATPLTACEVVTRADVEQALGRAVAGGEEAAKGREATCDYAGRDGIVSIAIQELESKPDLALEIASLRKEIPEGVVRGCAALPNAFFLDIPGAGAQLHVLSEGRHVMVSILGFGEAPLVSQAAERIAQKALARLR